jgi:tetratricopeptide (TPR) repeat protein
MRKVALLRVFVLLLLSVTPGFGQKKVKYKDIFELLNSKQYEQAESFLKDYLKENDDNPNAFLFMGLIYQEKSQKDDVLKQTKLAISHMDSSIYWLGKAYKTITEKEVKRNDEYYQAYNRRDLRTGEFGVKLADIQFDLEKRTQGLREKIDRVKMVKHFFTLSDSLYRKSNALFQRIVSRFPGEREFYLRSDSATVADLSALILRYDSSVKAFDQYKSSISTIGKIGYNQVLVKNEIKNFKTDGESLADFYQPEVKVWDYKAFAANAKESILKDIFPIREHLITYDIEINKLREKMNTDSISVSSDLTRLIDKLLMEQLQKYDPTPLPMDVFSVKIADLKYRSMLIEHKGLRDSSDVHFGGI